MLSGTHIIEGKLLRILLVEDDDDIRRDLGDFLRDEGYDVEVASNGQEALELLKHEKLPRLILLDLMMPIKDGFQFRLEQEADPRFSKIPVIIMSADGQMQTKQAKARAADYIKKPMDIFVILDKIKLHCG